MFGNSSLLTSEQYTLCLNQWESPSGSRVSDNHLRNWWISRQEQTGAGEGGEVEFTWWHVLTLLGSYCCLRTGIILLFYFQIITVHFWCITENSSVEVSRDSDSLFYIPNSESLLITPLSHSFFLFLHSPLTSVMSKGYNVRQHEKVVLTQVLNPIFFLSSWEDFMKSIICVMCKY